MEKFEHVDVLAAIDAIARQNTGYNQNDIEVDKQIIREAAEDGTKNLLWHSRPAGTRCVSEREAFIENTWANLVWPSYTDAVRLDDSRILAYAVELEGLDGEKVMGTLYALDYLQHAEHVKRATLPAAFVTLNFDDGGPRRFDYNDFKENEKRVLQHFGHFKGMEYEPRSKMELHRLLRQEHADREKAARPADLDAHVKRLADDKIINEAQRLVDAFQGLYNPNGGEGRFMVEVSPIFCNLANEADMKKLLAALPYKSLSVEPRDDAPGLFAFVSKEENRDQEVRRSVVARLRQHREPEASKHAKRPPAKTDREAR